MRNRRKIKLYKNLKFLKKLAKYTLDSKMAICQKYSSRLMSISEVSMDYILKETIAPWELEIFAVFSIVYDRPKATAQITVAQFEKIISHIKNYWHPQIALAEKEGRFADMFVMVTIIQQFSIQGPFLMKMFRYDYFFQFQNKSIDMEKEFVQKFGVKYQNFESFAFIIFLCCSIDGQKKLKENQQLYTLNKAFSIDGVLPQLTTTVQKYKELIDSQYNGNILDYYYGLKIQYLYPFIEGENCIYLPSPYLVINAITESLLNRLTDSNPKLRNKFGKEVMEEYLYSVYKENPSVTWISKEFKYQKGKNEILTPDVLVEENNCALLFDSKAMVPSLKIRQFNTEEIQKETNIYADKILQIYQRILDLQAGYYKLKNTFEQNAVFGVVAVLEDAAIARHRVYDKVFEKLSEKGLSNTLDVKNYIHSHIKIVPLNQIEQTVLIGHSYMECLQNQANDPKKWDNYTFFIPKKKYNYIPSYDKFIEKIRSSVVHILS